MSGRLQVALLLAALFGGYAVIGMVDADEAVRDAAQMRACAPKNAEQCAAARKQKEVKNVRRPRIFRA
jgi:hypothetical protein